MPTILPTSDILFDAWALTTIGKPLVDTPLPGRPPVAEYLHGVEDKEQPDTQFAWRDEVQHTEFILALRGDDWKSDMFHGGWEPLVAHMGSLKGLQDSYFFRLTPRSGSVPDLPDRLRPPKRPGAV